MPVLITAVVHANNSRLGHVEEWRRLLSNVDKKNQERVLLHEFVLWLRVLCHALRGAH